MLKATVEIKEVYNVAITVEYPEGATADEIRDLANKKFEEEGSDNFEYDRTLEPDTWTVRDEKGNYL